MSLEARLVAVGDQVAEIARRSPALGYQFRRPAEVFPGPERGTEEAIERIERDVGTLPLAIKHGSHTTLGWWFWPAHLVRATKPESGVR